MAASIPVRRLTLVVAADSIQPPLPRRVAAVVVAIVVAIPEAAILAATAKN